MGGKYEQALSDFQKSLQQSTSSKSQSQIFKEINVWISKCKVELGIKGGQKPPAPKVSPPPINQTTNYDPSGLSVPAPEKIKEEKKMEVEKPVFEEEVPVTWTQTDKKVILEIKYSLEKKEELKTKFEEKSASIEFPRRTGPKFEMNLSLLKAIVHDKVEVAANITKIDISMEKKEPNVNWESLEVPESPNKIPIKVAYPTSSKIKKDWSKIDKEIEKEEGPSNEDNGMGFFKELYARSDENTRKAMMKSYMESGGTSL